MCQLGEETEKKPTGIDFIGLFVWEGKMKKVLIGMEFT